MGEPMYVSAKPELPEPPLNVISGGLKSHSRMNNTNYIVQVVKLYIIFFFDSFSMHCVHTAYDMEIYGLPTELCFYEPLPLPESAQALHRNPGWPRASNSSLGV